MLFRRQKRDESTVMSAHVISQEALDVAALTALVSSPQAGALASFVGVVRNNSLGRQVRYLFYEAYAPMAKKEFERIAKEMAVRWDILNVAMAHRVGKLCIGEASVAIVVASAHRKEALEACAFAIERIKQRVPVWKKEYWEGGEVWLENAQGSTILPVNA